MLSHVGVAARCVAISCVGLAAWAMPARAGTIDLTRGWSATAPNGYDIAPDGADITVGTTTAQPIKLIVPNWTSLAPISIMFTNNSKQSDAPQPLTHFFLKLELTNKTGVDWQGFRFTIKDNNSDVNTEGLFHPTPAHFHTDFLDPAKVGFTDVLSQPGYNDLSDSRGIYIFQVTNGFAVNNNATWIPTVDQDKGLDLHDKFKFDGEQNITSFTLTLVPITPLPSSFYGGMALLGGLALWGFRMRLKARMA